MENKKSKQSEKARIGAIGENNVVSLLMQKSWDAFNANCTIKNYKSIDIVCIKERSKDSNKQWKPMTAFVQVKTCVQDNIPIGFSIEQCLNKTYLEEMVMGPYVFVSTKIVEGQFTFRYYIITRKQFIELAYQAHYYYVHGYKREKDINLKAPAGLCTRWLEGLSDKETRRHIAFDNPLKGISCENKWENIWNE